MPTITISELAQSIGGTVIGDGTRSVSSCNTLADASPDQISLLHVAKYAKDLETTRAGAVIAPPGTAATVQRADPLTFIEAKNAYYAWQQAMVKLMGHRRHPEVAAGGGISPLATIHPTAGLGKNVHIHPFVVISENCSVGDNTVLYPHVTLMRDVRIGNDCVFYPRVSAYENITVGNRVHVNTGTVLGSDGFAYAQANGVHHKMPQAGSLIIEDDVEIGSNSIIERGALNPTVIERGSKIGSLCVIGHNCRIGTGNIIISATCIAGSTTTGKYVVMAGQVGVAGHLNIPDFVKIGAQAGVMSNPEPNSEIVGTPAVDGNLAKRMVLQMMRLPELAKRVKDIERKLEELSSGGKVE
jgi:UDP-3-O-[3-hydroxymyristoyl] glucosamine N-acyltransferase